MAQNKPLRTAKIKTPRAHIKVLSPKPQALATQRFSTCMLFPWISFPFYFSVCWHTAQTGHFRSYTSQNTRPVTCSASITTPSHPSSIQLILYNFQDQLVIKSTFPVQTYHLRKSLPPWAEDDCFRPRVPLYTPIPIQKETSEIERKHYLHQ